VLVAREFETGRFLASCRYSRLVAYPADASGPSSLAGALQQLGAHSGRVGIEMSRHLDARSFDALRTALPDVGWRDATAALDEARVVKSGEELACLRKAASITDLGMAAALDAAREGASDHEIAAAAAAALLAHGSEFMCIEPIVAVGLNSSLAHSTANGRVAGPGEPVFVELGACASRYTAPLMRSAVIGSVSREVQELADYSSRILDAMTAVMRPGVAASEVARVAHRELAPVEASVAFHYVYGYSVGVGYPPSWLEETGFFLQPDNGRELRPGMVFHLPMTLRRPGRVGCGFSETVCITETGCEVLSALPRRLVSA
jgi:Xaa-Pro aminopeptidase